MTDECSSRRSGGGTRPVYERRRRAAAGSGRGTGGDRGQTNLDFALGVSIFLLTVIFVFSFVPGMLEPFTASTQRETAASDRIADQLAQEMLVSDPAKPYRLDRECTEAFFDPDNNDGAAGSEWAGGCNYAQDEQLPSRLGLNAGSSADLSVRLRLVRDLTTSTADDPDGDRGGDDDEPDTLCIDESDPSDDDPRIVEANDPGSGRECDIGGSEDDVLFEIGPTPPDGAGSVVAARRFVHVRGGFADGTSDAMLVVEVW